MFIHNPVGTEAVAKLKGGGSITLEKSETCALPQDATIAPGWKIAEASVRVLAVAQDGNTVTVVTYGKPGDTGQLIFATEKPLRLVENTGDVTGDLRAAPASSHL